MVALLAGTLLAACSHSVSTALPPGVTVDVYQSRFDYADHTLAVAVKNSSAHPFTVRELSFSSPTYSPAAVYERAPTTVRPGTSTDFRVTLPAADCDAQPGDPRVHIRYTTGPIDSAETTGEVTFAPQDRMGQLPFLAAEDCRGHAVDEVANIEPASALRFISLAGETPAVLDFTATPTGAGGVLTIEDVRGTVLLDAVNPATGKTGEIIPLGLDIGAASAPVSFSLTLIPARCDPHVVMEDKRGTFFTFTVTTKLDTGRIYVGVGDDVRGQLYDYVQRHCGWA